MAGCLLFAMTAHDFWSASCMGGGRQRACHLYARPANIEWYMDEHHRIRGSAKACFGIGTGGSFALMGWLLMVADVRTAALLAAGAALIAGLVVLSCVGPKVVPLRRPTTANGIRLTCARQPVAMGYSFALAPDTMSCLLIALELCAAVYGIAKRGQTALG